MSQQGENSDRPVSPEERFRLYIDESGDHVFNQLDSVNHRYLSLLGCWFRGSDYTAFHDSLQTLKRTHLLHSPDEPVILHRDDMINRRGAFWRLRDEDVAARFDHDLLGLISGANFSMVAVIIDKKLLQERYPENPAHPYHLAMGFLLQRYCGYLNHVSRVGDVMAESRGGLEDRLLKDSYQRVYDQGVWTTRAPHFQAALTSRELKLKQKSANISGLQLADILCHPVKQQVLVDIGHVIGDLAPFAQRLLAVCRSKYNRHLYQGHIEGYGTVMYPK